MAKDKDILKDESDENVAMAIIAYFIFFLPLLTTAGDDPYVRFHVKQGLVLLACSVLVWTIGKFLPLNWALDIYLVGGLILFILWLIGISHAISKKQKRVPLIGFLGERLNF